MRTVPCVAPPPGDEAALDDVGEPDVALSRALRVELAGRSSVVNGYLMHRRPVRLEFRRGSSSGAPVQVVAALDVPVAVDLPAGVAHLERVDRTAVARATVLTERADQPHGPADQRRQDEDRDDEHDDHHHRSHHHPVSHHVHPFRLAEAPWSVGSR